MEIFDEDGYPTEEFLEEIRKWDYTKGFTSLLEFALKGHTYPTYWERLDSIDDKTTWNISTGGWSGNESIVYALMDNKMFWLCCWIQSRRGGHYIFETKDETMAVESLGEPLEAL